MKKGYYANKEYKLLHQILCITSVDFQRRTLYGFVELHILPLVTLLSRIRINCKQCRIYRVCVKGQGLSSWLEAAFLTAEGGNTICQDPRKRNLDYFRHNLQNNVYQCDTENNGGEITVRLPSETMPLVKEKKMLRLSIEFCLDKPSSTIHFVVPNGEGSAVERACHMFSYRWGNSSRLWFPCIDSYAELCTWKVEVTCDVGMVAVCPGELTEKVYTLDEKRVTHHFTLSTPTSASNIGIAVGPFEIFPDPELADVTYFVLPGLGSLVKNSTSFLAEAFEFFEDSLNTQYPYATYKMIFVDEAYETSQAFATMGIFNTNLLHPPTVIDQPFATRRVLTECLAHQFFGMFVSIQSWADMWLVHGMSIYLASLYLRKAFGNNEYRHWLLMELKTLCDYEINGPGLPPLYPFPLAAIPLDSKQESKSESAVSPQLAVLQQHPHLISYQQFRMLQTKSHLVMRCIEIRIGQDLLLQAFNKVLSLSCSAATKKGEYLNWPSMLLSTTGFLRTISTVSGKDINIFVDQWICHSGVARFNASFSFNRKRNIIEIDITQFAGGKGTQKYVGPLIVCIQELDGSFSHTVQVEDVTSHHDLPCHSKSRRNKKKKIPLVTGEEVDMDLSATFDTDSPVLWVRIDPDMTWPRQVSLQQPDYMWQYQLRYERDVTSQLEAVLALEKYPCPGTRSALSDLMNQSEAFYRIRMEAAACLGKVATTESEVWNGDEVMIDLFEKMFGSNACAKIPKYNDFSNFIAYFLQRAVAVAISSIKGSGQQCPKRVFEFVRNLLKFSDNRFNQYSEGNYVSTLIEALTNTVGPAMDLASNYKGSERKQLPIDPDAKVVLSEVNRRINMEKILPSYRFSVTCACLKSFRVLQVNGHIPSESQLFRKYGEYGMFEDIRKTALEILVDFVLVHTSEKDLEWLLDIVERDPVPYIRHHVVQCLIQKPPFSRKSTNSPLNNLTLVERLWQLMNCDAVNDYRLRHDLFDLYNALWGTVTPACVPNHGFGVVIDLKEKKAVSNASANFLPASPELNASVSAGEEQTGPPTKKRKPSRERSLSPGLDDGGDSRPSTPKSMTSGMKLKIKIGGEDNDSGSEIVPMNVNTSADPLGLEDEGSFAKRLKKKKKKKHKHKDKEKKDRESSLLKDPLSLEDAPNSSSYSQKGRSDPLGIKEEPASNPFGMKRFDSSKPPHGAFGTHSSVLDNIEEEEDSDISDV